MPAGPSVARRGPIVPDLDDLLSLHVVLRSGRAGELQRARTGRRLGTNSTHLTPRGDTPKPKGSVPPTRSVSSYL